MELQFWDKKILDVRDTSFQGKRLRNLKFKIVHKFLRVVYYFDIQNI